MDTQDKMLVTSNLCGAKNRNIKGGLCKHPKGWGTDHVGTGRCKMHGGSSLKGRNHPGYKHGRRSTQMPARMLQDYKEAMIDPQLLSMRSDIAVTDARVRDLLKRVDSGEAGRLWRQASTAMRKFRNAQNSQSMETDTKRHIMAEALDELESLIVKGTGDYKAWDEFGKAVDQRRRLIESEHKRAVAMGQMMTAEAVLTLMDAIMNVINSEVREPERKAALALGIMKLIDKDFAYDKPDAKIVDGEFVEVL